MPVWLMSPKTPSVRLTLAPLAFWYCQGRFYPNWLQIRAADMWQMRRLVDFALALKRGLHYRRDRLMKLSLLAGREGRCSANRTMRRWCQTVLLTHRPPPVLTRAPRCITVTKRDQDFRLPRVVLVAGLGCGSFLLQLFLDVDCY
ncbi:hypothetical protein C8Q78DRAFT_781870 [Trametes maxima]|nr:hypothetical protein C8Q78DRAFT_781870 [Trametes maxima]